MDGCLAPNRCPEPRIQRVASSAIDWSNAAQTAVGNDAIPDYNAATNPPDPQQLTSDAVDALAYVRTGVDARCTEYDLYYAVRGIRVGAVTFPDRRCIGPIRPTAPRRLSQNQPWGVQGGIYENTPGDIGTTTGMAFVAGQLFGVSDTGRFYTIVTATGRASNVVNLGPVVRGLDPRSAERGGRGVRQHVVRRGHGGTLYALDTSGQLQGMFAGGATSVSTGLGGATGLAFSPADINLWHPTMERRADAGHGINSSFDNSRPANVTWDTDVNGRATTLTEGGASFYFGFEAWQKDPTNAYFTYGRQCAVRVPAVPTAHRDLASNTAIAGTLQCARWRPAAAWPRMRSAWPDTRRRTSPRCTSTTSWRPREPTA